MKIVFISFHNWETKRIGGFHKLASACSHYGDEVVFFSFSRPYFIVFKNEERLNCKVFKKLTKGTEYIIDTEGHKVFNCTWPTLTVPSQLKPIVPQRICRFLSLHSLELFSHFVEKNLMGTDVFVIESCEGIFLFDKLKKYCPNSKIVYRPSDPLMTKEASQDVIKAETFVLKNSDMVFLVNKEGLELYKSKLKDFEASVKWSLLPNGVDLEAFKKKYECPVVLNKPNTALYVGARDIEWDLILEAARKLSNINFVIVCPENPPKNFLNSSLQNLVFINGISPEAVPSYVTNCDVIIVPNPKDRYKIKPWGITAKYYQAMAAHKSIVCFDDTDALKDYGVYVAHSYGDFISDLCKVFSTDDRFIDYPLISRDWQTIAHEFHDKLIKIVQDEKY